MGSWGYRITLGVSLALAWVFTALQTFPRPISMFVPDYGFFLGMAERLRAGERLYVDVWDNKDPLVFYLLSSARTLGVPGLWLLEIAWVVMCSIAAYAIVRSARHTNVSALWVGFVLTPVIVLGAVYFMGSTHLPGVALGLAAVAAALDRRWLAAGLLLGVIVFVKLLMLPTALAGVLAVLLVVGWRRGATRTALGLVISIVALGALVAARGELSGFLVTQVANAIYSQAPIVAADMVGPWQKIAQHIVVLVNPHVVAIQLGIAVCLAVPWVRRLPWRRDSLWWATLASAVVSAATLLVTGKWLQHAEIYALPAVLALTLLLLSLPTAWKGWAKGMVTLVVAVLLAGVPWPEDVVNRVRDIGDDWTSMHRTDAITSALLNETPTTFALVGLDVPMSSGLEDWTLACRYLGQRPFHPASVFDEMRDCLPRAEVIVATYPRDPGPSAFPLYDVFLDDVEALIQRDYRCEEVDTFRVCSSRGID